MNKETVMQPVSRAINLRLDSEPPLLKKQDYFYLGHQLEVVPFWVGDPLVITENICMSLT
jgi:hypothetical protein